LAKLGKKDVCLVPIAFTSDHIETLYELDIEVAEEAEKVSPAKPLVWLFNDFNQLGVHLSRAESMNDSPIFVRAIADLVSGHLKDYQQGKIGPTSRQIGLRCPGCTNPKCGRTKEWLATGGREAAA
jgi:ferrochelatase